jgi:hypothetical protein
MENKKEVKVKVNGKELSLNPFVTGLTGNLIWALVSSLKLEEEAREVTIEVSR